MSSSRPYRLTSLARLIGTANAPALIDVRTDEDFAADPRLIPGSIKLSHDNVPDWGADFAGRTAIVVLPARRKARAGHGGLAAPARRGGRDARRRFRGVEGSEAAAARHAASCRRAMRKGRTVWVTRARPKVDRIACPWLIRRFVDPNAVFLFVAPSEVVAVAERFNAAPFDIEDVFWSHRGELCTFDVDDRGVRPRHAGRCCGWPRSCAAPTPRGRISRRKRPACSRPRSGCRACTPTISSSSRPACCSTTPSIAGAATPPARPTTGRPTR